MVEDSISETPSADPRQLLLHAPMSRFQARAIGAVVALCALDGFDVFAMTFAAPAVLADWGISQAEIGLALSAGLLGLALGSLLLSPLADVIGRRRMLFLALGIMIIGTAWTATVQDVTNLIVSRLFTGVGIGTMIPVIMPLAAEYANAHGRDMAVSLVAIGFPAGGLVGGLLSAYLLANFGWPAIFWTASLIGLVMVAVTWAWLRDPVAVVIARPGRNGLARVNDFLRRCGHAEVNSLPPSPIEAAAPMRALFASEMRSSTLKITLIYFLVVIPVFFMQTWLPTFISDLGVAPAASALIAAFFNVGGIVAGMAVAAISLRAGLRTLLNLALIGSATMIVLFSQLSPIVPVLIAASIFAGFFLQGAMVSLYAIIARTFPAHMRASGSGFVIGIGRIGSILPPLLAGALIVAGMGRLGVAITMAVPALLALAIFVSFKIRPTTIA